MRRWFAALALATAFPGCTAPATVSTIQTRPTPRPIVTIAPEEWKLLDTDILLPIRQRPAGGCPMGPVQMRAGVVPTVGNSPTKMELKAHEPTPVLRQLAGDYSGPILLRGRQYDGSAAVYFAVLGSAPTGSSTPTPDGSRLKTVETSQGAMQLFGGMRLSAIGGAHLWWMYVYTESHGCFFWQQNGVDYQGYLTFQVTA